MELNFANNLFLGKVELDFLKKSLQEKGFKRLFSSVVNSYGVVKLATDTSFDSMKLISGSSNGLISINPGLIIDKNQDVIELATTKVDAITVPSDSILYYVKISYAQSTVEEGTVDVSATGQLTGSGTKFLSTLRGLPDFPSKIKLNSATNTADYTIGSIASDTAAQLNIASGQLTAETGLKYQVVGTFTPGVTPSATERYPLKSDSFTVTLQTTNSVTAGSEFILGTVQNDGVSTTIVDLRTTNLFQIIGSAGSTAIGNITNPILGIESLRYNGANDDKAYNQLRVGWGLSSEAPFFSFNSTTNVVTVQVAVGGQWNSTTPTMTSGALNGWYLTHTNTGQSLKITSSSISGTNLLLGIETPATFPITGTIQILPPVQGIEFLVTCSSQPSGSRRVYFPIHSMMSNLNSPSGGVIPVVAGVANAIRWRYVSGLATGPLQNLPSGNYLPESSFNDAGLQTATTTVAYTSGATITPVLHTKAHATDKASKTESNTFTQTNEFFGKTRLIGAVVNSGLVTLTGGSTLHNTSYFGSASNPISGTSFKNTSGSAATITGFNATENGHIAMIKVTTDSTGNVVINHLDAGSAANNQIFLSAGTNKTLTPGQTLMLQYCGYSNKWLEL